MFLLIGPHPLARLWARHGFELIRHLPRPSTRYSYNWKQLNEHGQGRPQPSIIAGTCHFSHRSWLISQTAKSAFQCAVFLLIAPTSIDNFTWKPRQKAARTWAARANTKMRTPFYGYCLAIARGLLNINVFCFLNFIFMFLPITQSLL